MQYEVDLQGFKEWLEHFTQDAIVGRKGSATSCPVYNYLHDTDRKVCYVTTHTIYQDKIGKHFGLTPKAIGEFIQAIDAEPSINFVDESLNITAKRALEIFEQVCQKYVQ